MDLTSPKDIKEIMARYGAKPSKRLGQNFLINRHALNTVVQAAGLTPADFVLEVGPGIGTLTQELAKNAGRVLAVEKDKKMIEILAHTLQNVANVQIISGDILKSDELSADLPRQYKVAANIPYYLTSPLIRMFLESPPNGVQPQTMVLMLQKEVARRIVAKPGEMSILAVSVQFYARAEIVETVGKESFWPAPKVDSAVIKIAPVKDFTDKINPELFFKVVKAGFLHPRKQLVNNLTTLKTADGVKLDKQKVSEWLLKNKINPAQRPETLSMDDWVNLAKNFQ